MSDTPAGPASLPAGAPLHPHETTFDLIVLRESELLHHSTHTTVRQRLETCAQALQAVQPTETTLGQTVNAVLNALDHEHPDTTLAILAQTASEHGLRVHASSPLGSQETSRETEAPATASDPVQPHPRLFSVITEYEPGQIILEHFTSRASRLADLRERVEQFITEPEILPAEVVNDEQRLALLVATLLPAHRVGLAETVWNQRAGHYSPVIGGIPIVT